MIKTKNAARALLLAVLCGIMIFNTVAFAAVDVKCGCVFGTDNTPESEFNTMFEITKGTYGSSQINTENGTYSGWYTVSVWAKEALPEEYVLTIKAHASHEATYYFGYNRSSAKGYYLTLKKFTDTDVNRKKLVLYKDGTEVKSWDEDTKGMGETRIERKKSANGYDIVITTKDGKEYSYTDTAPTVVENGVAGVYTNGMWDMKMEEITWTYKRAVYSENLDVLTSSPKNTKSVGLVFSKPMSSLSQITVDGASITSQQLSQDGLTAEFEISAEPGAEYKIIVPAGTTASGGETTAEEKTFEFVYPAEEINDFDLETPKSGENKIVNDYKLSNDYTVSGEFVPENGGELIVYFNANETLSGDIIGYRAVLSGPVNNAAKVRIEKRGAAGEEWSVVAEEGSTVDLTEKVWFNLSQSQNSVTFEAVCQDGFATVSASNLDITNGFAGLGGASGTFGGVTVSAPLSNTYKKVEILEKTGPFGGFEVYKQSETIPFEIKLNKTEEDIKSVQLYVDEALYGSLAYDNGWYRASVSSLASGAHSAYVVVTDKFDTVYKIEAYNFCTGQGKFEPKGFECEGAAISSLADAAGKEAVASFGYDYSKDVIIIVCLYDANGFMKDMSFAKGANGLAQATISVPANLSGGKIKAFMSQDFLTSVPLSGTMVLE